MAKQRPIKRLELSVVVVSFNTCEMTRDCIQSVFRETIVDSFELIVLDNASSDDSPQMLTRERGGSSRMKLHLSSQNLGFAQGNNQAIQSAQGEYLLLLNPDTLVQDGAIDRLMAFARQEPQALIWGGRTLFADGSPNPASCWSRQTLWSLTSQALGLNSLFRRSTLFNPEGIGGWDRQGQREVDIVSGCFLLIKRDLWDCLGGFKPDFFMYGEEADLCLRARALGARPMVTSEATIVHYGGASEQVRADKMVRLLKAKMLLIREHFPASQRRLGFFLLSLWPFSRYWVFAILARLNPKWHDKLAVWRQIVHRRPEWCLR